MSWEGQEISLNPGKRPGAEALPLCHRPWQGISQCPSGEGLAQSSPWVLTLSEHRTGEVLMGAPFRAKEHFQSFQVHLVGGGGGGGRCQ